jgi:tetratricopeptide (TPR) repeat protein
VSTAYSNLINGYIALGKYDEAKAIAERAFASKVDSPSVHRDLLLLAYIEGDTAAANREIQGQAGKAEEYQSLIVEANHAWYLGQSRKARELTARSVALARQRGLTIAAAGFLATESLHEAVFEDCGVARALAREATAGADKDTLRAVFPAAVALSWCGDAAGAQKLAADIGREMEPTDTMWNDRTLPAIRAAIELKRGQPAGAIELIKPAERNERSFPVTVYVLGMAHLRARRGADALAAFQKVLDHKGAYYGPYYALAYGGAARAAVLAGDAAKAKKSYQDFLALWKDADPDQPLLAQARQELAGLQ